MPSSSIQLMLMGMLSFIDTNQLGGNCYWRGVHLLIIFLLLLISDICIHRLQKINVGPTSYSAICFNGVIFIMLLSKTWVFYFVFKIHLMLIGLNWQLTFCCSVVVGKKENLIMVKSLFWIMWKWTNIWRIYTRMQINLWAILFLSIKFLCCLITCSS